MKTQLAGAGAAMATEWLKLSMTKVHTYVKLFTVLIGTLFVLKKVIGFSTVIYCNLIYITIYYYLKQLYNRDLLVKD